MDRPSGCNAPLELLDDLKLAAIFPATPPRNLPNFWLRLEASDVAGEGVRPANAVPGGVCQAGRTVPWLPPCGGSCCKI